jgi:hypothetical protein
VDDGHAHRRRVEIVQLQSFLSLTSEIFRAPHVQGRT